MPCAVRPQWIIFLVMLTALFILEVSNIVMRQNTLFVPSGDLLPF